jgi:gliding motility-associated-like protein
MLRLLCLLLGGTLAQTLAAQSSEGRDFWFTFLRHRDVGQTSMVAMISAREATSGTLEMPGTGWSQPFAVGANNVTLVNLPQGAETLPSESIANSAVHLRANGTVSVYIHQYFEFRSEAALVLPTPALGREYYVMSYPGVINQGQAYASEFAVVATEDDTEVAVEQLAAATLGGRSVGQSFSITLQAGEVYQVRAAQATGDLTGTRVVSDKAVAVFGGNEWTEVPTGCQFRDNLLEEMYPVESWGTEYAVVPGARVNGNVYRVLAAAANTTVTIDGTAGSMTFTLGAGEFREFERSDGFLIQATQPVLAAQYYKGIQCSGHSVGDPSMVLLNATRQTLDTVTIYSSSFEEISENYLNIVLQAGDEDQVTLDGAPLTGPFLPIGTDGRFVYRAQPVSAGSHTLISGGCGVIVTAYGYGNVESYAYGGGAAFRRINANPIVEGGCLNDTIYFDTGLDTARFEHRWTLEDGSVERRAAFARVYDELGSFSVELIVYDRCLDIRDTSSRDLAITLRQQVAVGPDAAVCTGGAVSFTATDVPGARYEWRGPNGYFSETQTIALNAVTAQDSGAYAVIGIVSGCATFPAENRLTVRPLPEPELGPELSFCPRETSGVTVDAGPYAAYRWSSGQTRNPVRLAGPGAYAVTVTDAFGCTGSDSLSVVAFCPTAVYVPNAFSPNDDGVNDDFAVAAFDADYLRLRIYDRWGNQLYEETSAAPAWNGRSRGRPAEPGTYVWTLDVRGVRADGTAFAETRAGELVLIR